MIADNFFPSADRNVGGRPPHEATAASREQVETLSGYGLPQEQIADFMGVSVETLMKHYGLEMKMGRAKADIKVAGSIFRKAISDEHPQSMAAAKWWEQTRAGRREKQDVNHSGNIGVFDATKLAHLTDDELVRLNELRTRLMLAGSGQRDPGGVSEEGG